MTDHGRLPLHRRIKQACVPFVGAIACRLYLAYMRLVLATSTVVVAGVEALAARRSEGKDTVVAMLHQDLLAAPALMRTLGELSTLVSVGDAGAILMAVLNRCGITATRGGSSTRVSRRSPVLQALVREGRKRKGEGFITIITPDGSRGPAGVCRGGIAVFACQVGVDACCLDVHASRAYYLPTWDQTMLPLPFGKITVELSAPIKPVSPSDRDALEAMRVEIETTLHTMHNGAFEKQGIPPRPRLTRLPAEERLVRREIGGVKP